MSDRYEQLKAEFTKEIIGDGNTDRPAVERKITRLRDTFFEKEERLIQSVKDVKAEQDQQLRARAIGRLQEEKAALDDAILDVLENQGSVVLPKFDEVAHTARKALDIPQRQVNIIPAAIKATLFILALAGAIYLFITVLAYLLSYEANSVHSKGASVEGYTTWTWHWLGPYISGVLNFNLTPTEFAFTLLFLLCAGGMWCAFFALSRKVR